MTSQQQTTIKTHTRGSDFAEFKGVPRFRFVECNVKKEGEGGESISGIYIKQAKLMDFIKTLGYRCIVINEVRHLVYMRQNILNPVDVQDIRQHVMHYINSLNFMVHHLDPHLTDEYHHSLILEKFSNGIERLFNKHLMYTQLFQKDATFSAHTATKAFFYFNNTAVEVTKNGVKQISYSELPGYIWRGQIIDRDFVPNTKNEIGQFEQFIDLVTGSFGAGYVHEKNADKKKMLSCMLGYLLHQYSNEESKAVVLTDDSEREDQGRTGKGLILGDKQNGAMRNFLGQTFVWINGKTVDVEKAKSFAACGVDTALIHFDDLNKDLTGKKIDLLFPLITAGVESQKHYAESIVIKPKIAISTNKIMKINTDSTKARFWIKPLCRYFTADRTPKSIFGTWFWGPNWPQLQWALFDNFMLNCVVHWFKFGFYNAPNLGLNKQLQAQHFDPDFIEWIEDYTDPAPENNRITNVTSSSKDFDGLFHVKILVRDGYDEYTSKYKKNPNFYSITNFRETIESYCDQNENILSHSAENRAKHPKLFYKSNGGKPTISIVFLK